MSDRDGHWEIYVMDNDGDNQRTLLTILVKIRIPHGPLTVNALPSCLIGMGTLTLYPVVYF